MARRSRTDEGQVAAKVSLHLVHVPLGWFGEIEDDSSEKTVQVCHTIDPEVAAQLPTAVPVCLECPDFYLTNEKVLIAALARKDPVFMHAPAGRSLVTARVVEALEEYGAGRSTTLGRLIVRAPALLHEYAEVLMALETDLRLHRRSLLKSVERALARQPVSVEGLGIHGHVTRLRAFERRATAGEEVRLDGKPYEPAGKGYLLMSAAAQQALGRNVPLDGPEYERVKKIAQRYDPKGAELVFVHRRCAAHAGGSNWVGFDGEPDQAWQNARVDDEARVSAASYLHGNRFADREIGFLANPSDHAVAEIIIQVPGSTTSRRPS